MLGDSFSAWGGGLVDIRCDAHVFASSICDPFMGCQEFHPWMGSALNHGLLFGCPENRDAHFRGYRNMHH